MISLATKYRPKTFDDVIGQDSIVKILKKQIELRQFKNCFIFYGASGCGKTTCARIYANEINMHQGSPIEIDAASNNGVDNVREIIKSANERSLDSEYKIYIIDEAHVLTSQSWQAFLKCIEEPPQYTIFIFCTTEKNKIPDTIKNRCQVFNFNRINPRDIEINLNKVCNAENFTNFTEACNYISKISKGQMRDALANLEKCASYSTDLSINNVIAALGDYSYDNMFKLFNGILDNNVGIIYDIIERVYEGGIDLKLYIDELLNFSIDLSKYVIFKTCDVTKIPTAYESELKHLTMFDNSITYYNYYTNKLLELKNMLKNDINPLSTIEVMLCKMARLEQ